MFPFNGGCLKILRVILPSDKEDEMDTVIRFPVERLSKRARARNVGSETGKSAEILFFSGVRYSPLNEKVAQRSVKRVKASGSKKLT